MHRSSNISSDSSSISTSHMERILEQLKSKKNRNTTLLNYHSIWRNFNKFVIKLDRKPHAWEEKASLFGAFLVERGVQSSTLKSYFSAIKSVLVDDGYLWNDNKVVLSTLTKACKLVNDRVVTRLPIQDRLLEMILFELQRMFKKQPYLEILFKSMIILGYYGMLRVGEMATGTHPIRAKDVHVARNKNKILFILYTSKTHGYEAKPQKVQISESNLNATERVRNQQRFFSPYDLIREYLLIRGNYTKDSDPFFVLSDGSVVCPSLLRKTLRTAITRLNLDATLYNVQSLRIGRCTDMVTVFNYTISQAKSAGRWKSNTVYKYIRSFQF